MKVLWINPVGTAQFDEDMRVELERAKRPDTEVEVWSLEGGPTHVEYHAYEAEVVPPLLRLVARAERDGFDATAIGCFYDTGLRPAKEIAQRMAVTAPCEATTRLAACLGDRFSVLGVTRKTIPEMRDNVERYGLGGRLASFRILGLGVHEFHIDPDYTQRQLIEDGRRAVEDDGAEVLILGCTVQHEFYRTMQDELGVPVLDPVVTTFKFAEFLAEAAGFGWTISKVGGYKAAPPEEVRAFGLEALLPTAPQPVPER